MWKWRIAQNAIFHSTSAICTSSITRLVCPPKFFHNPCTLFPLGIKVVPREIKDCLCKKINKVYYGRCENSELSLLAFPLFYWKRANLARIYKIFITLTLIKTWWKKRHADNCGSYENDIFCEIGKFGKDSSKIKNHDVSTSPRSFSSV